MAGDWIKMRIDLQTSPKVVRIASALKADRLRVVGGLHAIWSLFDSHSEDGNLEGYTPEILDSIIGFNGFCNELINCQWLIVSDRSLCMPRFDEHNGKSAKKRAMDSERKRESRKQESVLDLSVSEADKSVTREEKRREEKNINTLTSSDDDKPVKIDKIDYQQVIDLFNTTLPELASVKLLTDKRKSAIRSCVAVSPRFSEDGFWKAYFEKVRESDFLMGRAKDWKADFDFLTTRSKFVKVLEGSY